MKSFFCVFCVFFDFCVTKNILAQTFVFSVFFDVERSCFPMLKGKRGFM